jgi:hypothetical protein
MNKSVQAITLASALLFSMGAMAQSGGTGGASGGGSPTQNMGKDNPNMAQPGGASDTTTSPSTKKHKAKHKKSTSETTPSDRTDGVGAGGK